MTIKFEPRDVWIGWFWDRRCDGLHHYVCVIPMLVIHWVTQRRTQCECGLLPDHASDCYDNDYDD